MSDHTDYMDSYNEIKGMNISKIEKSRLITIIYNRAKNKKSRDKRLTAGIDDSPISLNTYLPEHERHHITRNIVISIPREIHRKYKHDLINNMGMTKINKIAFQYMQEEVRL